MLRTPLWRQFPLSYFFAAAMCVLVVALKLAFPVLGGNLAPFLLFFFAVVVSAWNGGFGAGVFAASLSSLLVAKYFLSPHEDLALSRIWLGPTLSFLIESSFLSFLTAYARQTQEKMTRQAARQTALAELARLALTNENMEQLWERGVTLASQTLDAQQVALLELERGDGEDAFVVRGAHNLKWSLGWRLPTEHRISANRALERDATVADVASSGTTRSKNSVSDDAVLRVPIGPVEQVWGVLEVFRSQREIWPAEDVEFARALADALGVVIEREQARRAASEGEVRYRAFVAQSGEAIWCFELDEPFEMYGSEAQSLAHIRENAFLVECNDIYAQFHGFESAADMIGMRVWQLLDFQKKSTLAFLRAAFWADFKVADVEMEEVAHDGTPHILLNSLVGITESGKLLRIWGTQRDVTEEKRAMSALAASEKRFRTLFDSSPLAISIIRDGKVLYVNQAIVEMLGYDAPEQIIGRRASEFVPSGNHTPLDERILLHLEKGVETASYDAEGIRRNGMRFPMRVDLAELHLPDGKASLLFTFDLTEQKKNEAEIAALLKKERRATIRALRLREIAVAMGQSLSLRELAHVALDRAIDALGASAGSIMVPVRNERDKEPTDMVILESLGYPEVLVDLEKHYPITDPIPPIVSYRHNTPLWMSDVEERIEEFPIFKHTITLTHTRAMASIPLEVEGRTVGSFNLSFPQTRQFDEEQRAFIITLAAQVAQGLERARLDAEAKDFARRQQETLALLNSVLESAPVGVALFDAHGRFLLANEALARISQVPVDEHIGRTPRDVVPNMAGVVERVLEQVWLTGEPSGELDVWTENPELSDDPRYCLMAFFPVRIHEGADAGEMFGVGAVWLDITDRVRAEREKTLLVQQLENERARFEAILQQMPSAVLLGQAPNGEVSLGNPQVEKVLGRSVLEIQDVVAHSFHLDGRPLLPEEWPLTRAVAQGETVQGVEIVVPHENGQMSIIRANAAPIRDWEGKITAGIMVFDDATDRARNAKAQEFLAEAGSTLVSTLDEHLAYEQLAHLCVPRVADWCIIAVPDEHGLLHEATIAHADGSKWEMSELFKTQLAQDPHLPWDVVGAMQGKKALLYQGHSIAHLRDIGTSDAYLQLIERIGAKSAIVASLSTHDHIVGVMIWITAESNRLYDQADLVLADELARRAALTVENARLFKESQVARDSAQVARDEAQNANRTKDEFLAVVSHELRTPLTPILGWLDLLRMEGIDDAMRAQAYDVIERNANAQAQLINDILDVSRITSGKLRLEMKSCDLASSIEKTVESLQTMAKQKGVTLESQIHAVGQVSADAGRLQQILWNLLQNSIKFTPTGGIVRVELDFVTGHPESARLSVSDTGNGINLEFLPHVFDRFRQADSSSTRKAGGLGLGLAIVHHLVELHGGRVEAHSAGEGKGAEFVVELPLLVEASAVSDETQDQPLEAEDAVLYGVRVLLVDDEPDTRDTLARVLAHGGASVQVAPSAQRALEAVRHFCPDIVVSDIGMPEMDGYQLRQLLRELWPTLPVVALTAYAAPTDIQRARDAGFEKHLAKPVSAKDLVAAVAEIVPFAS